MIVSKLLIGSHAVLLSLLACATTPVFAQTQTNSESNQSAIKGLVDGIGASDVLPDAGVEKTKTITITEELLLPEIDLGRIEPGNVGHFLIGIDTKLPLRSECVQVAKACGCTKVTLAEGRIFEPGKPFRIALDTDAKDGHGTRQTQFYMAFRNTEGYVKVTQPLKFSVEREYDFGPGELLSFELFEDDSSRRVSIKNNSGNAMKLFEVVYFGNDGAYRPLDTSIINDASNNPSISIRVGELRNLMDEKAVEELQGELQIFAGTLSESKHGVIRQVATIPTKIRAGVKVRVLPEMVFMDSATSTVTLRVLASKKTSGLQSDTLNVKVTCGDELVASKTRHRSPHWVDVELDADDLKHLIGKKIALHIDSPELRGDFSIPISK